MKVKDLIKSLSEQDQDSEVYFSHDSHDHWGSMLASPVSEIEETEICYSAYHTQYSVPKSDEYDDDEDKRKYVILLS